MDNNIIPWIVGALGLFLGIFGVAKKMKKTARIWVTIAGVGLIALAFVFVASPEASGWLSTLSVGEVGTGTNAQSTSSGVVTYQPIASYATQDKYSTTSVAGTSYYKTGGSLSGNDVVGGQPATTTAITNTNKGTQYVYWVDNSTYWVKPYLFTASGTDNVVNKESLQNGSGTLTLYDSKTGQAITLASHNASMAANGQAFIRITYEGTKKYSAVPFGGLFVVEYNNTMSDVSCTGDGVLGPNSQFQLTYTANNTVDVYKAYELEYGFDDGTGQLREINCQFNNGATDPGDGSPFFFRIIPANYYVANNGNIYLDTEKSADDSTTRIGSNVNLPFQVGYWT